MLVFTLVLQQHHATVDYPTTKPNALVSLNKENFKQQSIKSAIKGISKYNNNIRDQKKTPLSGHLEKKSGYPLLRFIPEYNPVHTSTNLAFSNFQTVVGFQVYPKGSVPHPGAPPAYPSAPLTAPECPEYAPASPVPSPYPILPNFPYPLFLSFPPQLSNIFKKTYQEE